MHVFRYSLDMSEVEALEELMEYVPAVVEWACNFLRSEPQQGLGDIEFARCHCFAPSIWCNSAYALP